MKPKKIYINNVWSKNYLVQKILATDAKKKLILFLKKQNLIKYDLIKKNLSLNYNKKLPVGFVLKNKWESKFYHNSVPQNMDFANDTTNQVCLNLAFVSGSG